MRAETIAQFQIPVSWKERDAMNAFYTKYRSGKEKMDLFVSKPGDAYERNKQLDKIYGASCDRFMAQDIKNEVIKAAEELRVLLVEDLLK